MNLSRRAPLVVLVLGGAAALASARAADTAPFTGARLFVDAPRLVRVPVGELRRDGPAVPPAADAYPIAAIDARDHGLELTCQGKSVPFVVLDAGNTIAFWAEGEPDGDDARGACYHLRDARQGSRREGAPRFGLRKPLPAPPGDLPAATFGIATARPRERRAHHDVPILEAKDLAAGGRPGGYRFFLPAKTGFALTFDLPGLAKDDGSADLVLERITGESIFEEKRPGGGVHRTLGVVPTGAVSVIVNEGREYDGEGATFRTGIAPASAVFHEGQNKVKVAVAKAGFTLVGDARLDYPRVARFDTAEGVLALKLDGPTAIEGLPERALVLDVTSGDVLAVARAGTAARVAPAAKGDLVVAFDPAKLKGASAVAACATHQLALEGQPTWVAVAPRAALEALAPLVAHRARGGLKAAAVALEDVACAEADGRETAQAVGAFLAKQKGLRFALLVGDAVDSQRPQGDALYCPTSHVDTFENGGTASDWPATPAGVALGRAPFRATAQLERYVARVIAYETTADHGPWRRSLAFVCGEGRFGPMVDGAIEGLFARAVDKRVPAPYGVDLTYANPRSIYLYPPDQLSKRVSERLAEGCLLLDYIGHGQPYALDDLHWDKARYPIFTRDDASKIDTGDRPPIVLITACSTGHFDGKEPCVAEALLANPRGAIAVLAATRISHPFANAILSLELEARLFLKADDVPAAERPRLGERVRGALDGLALGKDDQEQKTIELFSKAFLTDAGLPARLLKDERHLYHLFGDPALEIAFPSERIAVEAPAKLEAGDRLAVRGKAPRAAGGRAIVTLEVGRAQSAKPATPLPDDTPAGAVRDPAVKARIAETYARANDRVEAKVEVQVGADGAFEAVLEPAYELAPGKRFVKVYAWSAGGSSNGATTLDLAAPTKPRPEPPKPPELPKPEPAKKKFI